LSEKQECGLSNAVSEEKLEKGWKSIQVKDKVARENINVHEEERMEEIVERKENITRKGVCD
jgi:hypothetical protein